MKIKINEIISNRCLITKRVMVMKVKKWSWQVAFEFRLNLFFSFLLYKCLIESYNFRVFFALNSVVSHTKALLLARHKSWQRLRMGKWIHDQYAFLKMLLLAEGKNKKNSCYINCHFWQIAVAWIYCIWLWCSRLVGTIGKRKIICFWCTHTHT